MFSQEVCGQAVMVSAGVITGGGQAQFNAGNVIGGTQPGNTLTQLLAQSGQATGLDVNRTPLSLMTNCDPDWGFFQGGVRTQWNPTRGFLMGIDIGYVHNFTAFRGSQANLQNVAFGASSGNANVIEPVVGARPNGVYNLKNLGSVQVVVRAQRNFNSGD